MTTRRTVCLLPAGDARPDSPCAEPAVAYLRHTQAEVTKHGPLMPYPVCAAHLRGHASRAVPVDEVAAGTATLPASPDLDAFLAVLAEIGDPG